MERMNDQSGVKSVRSLNAGSAAAMGRPQKAWNVMQKDLSPKGFGSEERLAETVLWGATIRWEAVHMQTYNEVLEMWMKVMVMKCDMALLFYMLIESFS